MLVQRVAARFENDGGRVVAIPDLHGEVVNLRLHIVRPQVRGHPRDVPREGLLDRELPDRAPLHVVGLQQPGPGYTREGERQLPGEVMRVLYAGIAAVSAVRRYHVCGVAGQEHAPVLKALRGIGHGSPGRDVLDDNRYIGDADGGTQQLKGTLLRDPLGDVGPWSRRVGGHDLRAGYVSHEVDHQEAGVTASVEPEEPPQQRVRHVVDALIPIPEQRPEIGLRTEVDRDAVRQKPMTVHANAEQFADRAAVSVGRDDVFRVYRTLRPAGEIADDGRDAVSVLLERHALGAVTQPRAELLGTGTEYRLKRILIDEQPHGRAELIDPGVEVREVVRDLPAR